MRVVARVVGEEVNLVGGASQQPGFRASRVTLGTCGVERLGVIAGNVDCRPLVREKGAI